MYQKFLIKKILKTVQQPSLVGILKLKLSNGEIYEFKGKGKVPVASLSLKKDKVITNLLFGGDVAFARDYKNGLWKSDNLSNLVEWSLLNESAIQSLIYGNKINQIFNRLSYLLKVNTIKQSRDNIYKHYDLGNHFYSLWLDSSMTYSSAIFKKKDETLKQAQENKYNRILDIIGEKSRKILEIGCGWGGFIEKAAQKNHKIDGLTISKSQFEYTKDRMKQYSENSNLFLKDYRNHTGFYDIIVSIEMFEAVGEKYWSSFFRKIKDCLVQSGKAIIQTITISDVYFEQYRKSGDAIRSYIFPGGMLASKTRFEEEAEKTGLKVLDMFSFGKDYTKTLEIWLKQFQSQRFNLYKLNFNDSFIHLWEFYLAYCIGGFRSGRIDVVQATLSHK